MERQVNETFDFMGTTLQVVKNEKNSCIKEDGIMCYFFQKNDCFTEKVGYCSRGTRKAKNSIIFVEYGK